MPEKNLLQFSSSESIDLSPLSDSRSNHSYNSWRIAVNVRLYKSDIFTACLNTDLVLSSSHSSFRLFSPGTLFPNTFRNLLLSSRRSCLHIWIRLLGSYVELFVNRYFAFQDTLLFFISFIWFYNFCFSSPYVAFFLVPALIFILKADPFTFTFKWPFLITFCFLFRISLRNWQLTSEFYIEKTIHAIICVLETLNIVIAFFAFSIYIFVQLLKPSQI